MLYRVGGLFIVVASIGFGSLLAVAQAGLVVDGLDNPLFVGLFYAAVAGGLGAWWVGRHGTIKDEGVFGRFGLGLVAVGLAAAVVGRLLITFIAAEGDPSADPAYLLIARGFLSGLVGQIVTGLAFIARGGAHRAIGGLLFAGAAVLLLAVLLLFVGNTASVARLAALAISLVGWLWLGVLVSRSGNGPQNVPSATH
jgi:hypothetical protein